MSPRSLLVVAGFTLSLSHAFTTSALAAVKCYEEQELPPVLVCDNKYSNSADFSSGCQYTTGKTVQIEVACPVMWVNISVKNETHSQTCNRVGLKTSSIEGSICASGELRPSIGQNWEGISYRFGKWGGLDTYGGNQIVSIRDYTSRGNKDESGRFYEGGLYCYKGGTKDRDNTDRVVAYACGPSF